MFKLINIHTKVMLRGPLVPLLPPQNSRGQCNINQCPLPAVILLALKFHFAFIKKVHNLSSMCLVPSVLINSCTEILTSEQHKRWTVVDLAGSGSGQFVKRLGVPGKLLSIRITVHGPSALRRDRLSIFIHNHERRYSYTPIKVLYSAQHKILTRTKIGSSCQGLKNFHFYLYQNTMM